MTAGNDTDWPCPGATLASAELEPVAPIEALLRRPERYGFFQAVRLLYRHHGLPNRRGGVEHDPVRFGAAVSLAFPAGELADIKGGAELVGRQSTATMPAQGPASPARHAMTVNFLGLTGPSGALPRHYTEWLIGQQQARDHSGREFLDLFNHRLVHLFWQAWSKHRPDVMQEFRQEQSLLRYIHDLVGMGTPALVRNLARPESEKKPGPAADAANAIKADSAAHPAPFPASALAYFCGLVSQRPHSAGSLARIIGDIVSVPVSAESCVGTWQAIPENERTRLGAANARLGDGLVLGQSFWDRQTTLQLRVGPLEIAQFRSLLPSGPLLNGLVEVCRFMTGMALDLRMKLELRADAIPPLRLGRAGADAARLGWSTWLAGRRDPAPADECCFHFSAMGGQSWR